jgi:hypothetical protein
MGIFPVFSLDNREFARDEFAATACTASKSLISENIRPGFERLVRIAAVCGPQGLVATRTGPGERGLSVLSVNPGRFSLVGSFAVRFSD